jgi:kynureninase
MSEFPLTDIRYAEALDAADVLKAFRSSFHFPKGKDGKEVTYLCGNSLGLQPKKAAQYVQEEMEDWAKFGVEGHFQSRHPWLPYHELLTEDLAALVGAERDEVVAMNTLTVNLHLMLTSFYRPKGKRTKILMGFSPFPSDQYAVSSQVALHGLLPQETILHLSPREGEVYVRMEDAEKMIRAHGDELALILVEGINYYSGQALPLEKIAKLGAEVGAYVGVDLAHTIGNLPLQLHQWGIDFAVWCSYKYLNGGPGCVGGCFVHQRHGHAPATPRLAGWWGHDKTTRFKMGPDFHPISGVEGWQLSNPPILPLAALRAALELFREAGIQRLRAKSEALTTYLEELLEVSCAGNVSSITPKNPAERGCQLSLRVKGGRKTHDRLIAHEVICDWREPDVVRIAPAPLYNSFADIYRFVHILKECFV